MTLINEFVVWYLIVLNCLRHNYINSSKLIDHWIYPGFIQFHLELHDTAGFVLMSTNNCVTNTPPFFVDNVAIYTHTPPSRRHFKFIR